jgi:hypothetical protein
MARTAPVGAARLARPRRRRQHALWRFLKGVAVAVAIPVAVLGPYRFSWRGAVPEDNEPAYWASGADWLTLVAKFGLAPNLAGQR